MKYYVYISDSKIEMLLGQISHSIGKKISHEMKIDLKLFSAERKTERALESTRIEKLEAVTRFIYECRDVGDIDKPDEYVAGTLEMKWGPYGADRVEESRVVYFGGQTDRTIVGLGGSAHNLLGGSGTSLTHSYSITPTLLAFLESELEDDDSLKTSQRVESSEATRARALRAVNLATTRMRGPMSEMEFLAKRLLFGADTSGKMVLFATPLYVALNE